MAINWNPLETVGWTQRSWKEGSYDASYPRIDPYLVWGAVTTFADFDPDTWVPVIIELTEPAANFAQDMLLRRDWIRIPAVYRFPSESLKGTRFCTATVTKECFKHLDAELKARVKRFELGLPVISDTDTETDTQSLDSPASDETISLGASPGAAGPIVVVGIIDEGLAFAHERFRQRGGPSTRIEWFWNQEGESKVAGLGYGTELAKAQIDRMLRDATQAGRVDEDQVYLRAAHGSVRRRILHGTHVMDLACGLNPAEVEPTSPRIICVELPRQTVRDTSGLSLAVHALDGLRYILDRADRLSRGAKSKEPWPVVVNLSYGNIAGPHDGSSMLEAAIDELIESRRKHGKLEIVLPAGNNHLSRCHARLALEPGGEKTLHWRILPDDTTPSFLEIWLPGEAKQSMVAVQVVTPWGDASDWVGECQAHARSQGNHILCTVVYLDRVATGDGKMILVAIAPTATLDPGRSVAAAGTWDVRLKNSGTDNVTIEAWIQRDDTPYGYPRGRQSRFEDPKYVRFDAVGRPKEEDDEGSYIKRAGTINAIATGKHTVVVGGYRDSDGAAAPYSACGSTPDSNRSQRGPQAMAVSERSITRRGILAAAARSGSKIALNGTSVAAPQVTRWIADEMSKGRYADQEAVKRLANEQDPDRAQKPAPPGEIGRKPKPPGRRGGAGRLRLAAKANTKG